jgi:hypothetical protein
MSDWIIIVIVGILICAFLLLQGCKFISECDNDMREMNESKKKAT